MANFFIAGIRKDKASGHIQQVQLIFAGTSKKLVADREFVARLIGLGSASFQTIFWSNNAWRYGAEVIVYDEIFITTAANSKVQDNLENLPEF